MISISGCETYNNHPTNVNWLIAESLPPFPIPDPKVADELTEACPSHKCIALYDWLGRLKVLQEQLELYKVKPHE